MSQTSQAFFVKIRGRTIGPFSTERLGQMAQQGQLSRVNMISADGQLWQRAGDFPQLFEAGSSPKSETAKAERQAVQSDGQGANFVPGQSQAGQQIKADWFYAVGTDQKGPLTFGQLRELIQSGMLSANELVWKEGMTDWKPIEDVREFSASLPQRIVVNERGRGKRIALDDLDMDEELKETQRIIRSTTPWVYFICIALYVLTGLLFFGFIAGVILGAKLQNDEIIVQAVINLLMAGVVVTAAIFLNRYSSAGSRFVSRQNFEDLNSSLRWMGRFWLFVGIVLIIFLTFLLIGIITAIAIGTDLSTYSPWTT